MRTDNKTTDVFTVEPKEVSDLMNLESCVNRESVTMETVTAVVKEAQLVPTRRKSQTALSSVQPTDVQQQQQKQSEGPLSPQSPRSEIKRPFVEECPKLAKTSEPETICIVDVKPEQTQREPIGLDSSTKLQKSVPMLPKNVGVLEAKLGPTRDETVTSERENEEEPEIPKSSKPIDPSLTTIVKETKAILTGSKGQDDSKGAVDHIASAEAKVKSGTHSRSTNENPLHLRSSQTFETAASEPASDVSVSADVQTKHIQAESEATAVEQTNVVPTQKKSKTSESSMKVDHTELEKTESSKPGMEAVALEQAKRYSKGVLPAETSVSSMKLTDAELEQNMETESLRSPQSPLPETKTATLESKSPTVSRVSGLQKPGNKTTDVKTLQTESVIDKATEEPLPELTREKSVTKSADVQTKSDTSTGEKTELVTPTDTSMKPADAEPESSKDSDTANKTTDVFTVEPKEVSDLMNLESCVSRESVTMETMTAVVEEAQCVPTRRRSQPALSSVQLTEVQQQQQKDSEGPLSPQSPRSDIKRPFVEECPKLAKTSEPGTICFGDVKPEQTQKEPSSLDSSIQLHKSLPREPETAGVLEAKPLKETQSVLTESKGPGDSKAAADHVKLSEAKVESKDEMNLVPASVKSNLELSSILLPINAQEVPTDTHIFIMGQTLHGSTKTKSPELVTTSETLSSSGKTFGHLKPGEMMDLVRPAEISMNLEETNKVKGSTEQSVSYSEAHDRPGTPNVQSVGSTKEGETIVEVEISPMSEQSRAQSSIEIQVVDPVPSPFDQQDPGSVVSLIITDSVTGPSITAVVEETQVVPTGSRQSLEVSKTSESSKYVTGPPDVKTSKPDQMKTHRSQSTENKPGSGAVPLGSTPDGVGASDEGLGPGEKALVEVLPTGETQGTLSAGLVYTSGPVLEGPEDQPMEDVLSEVHQLLGTGPDCLILKGELEENPAPVLDTSIRDLEVRLNRLETRVLACRNRPTDLSPEAMALQLEEAQECLRASQTQVSLLTRPSPELEGGAAGGPGQQEELEHLEGQWSAAVGDSSTLVRSKEARLRLVSLYTGQTEVARATLEGLETELEAGGRVPDETSSNEEERLHSFLRHMEENRMVLGELVLTHSELVPHLSPSNQGTVQRQLRALQDRWRSLENTAERSLHALKAVSCDSSTFLYEMSSIEEQLEDVSMCLEAPATPEWDPTRAQELMVASAVLAATQQRYLLLLQASDALDQSSRQGESQSTKTEQRLQKTKLQLEQTAERLASQTPSSTNPTLEKIVRVIRDAFIWAKQTEVHIKTKRGKIALLPEDVHRQIRDLKKLQSEVTVKQGQLEVLLEEVTELFPQMDQEKEVPMVRSSLEDLNLLSMSTTEDLTTAVREIESGLQNREKMSEQIADVEAWAVWYFLQKASSRGEEDVSVSGFDRQSRQIWETLADAEKQSVVCEALLMKSKDIFSELSVTENRLLHAKLTDLKEDITNITSYALTKKQDLESRVQTQEASKQKVAALEKNLRQMLVDLNRHRFPVTRESLRTMEALKHMIVEHKSQVDQLHASIPLGKRRELLSVNWELYGKMSKLDQKARDHECYLNLRQSMEDIQDNMEQEIFQTKEESRGVGERYRMCNSLLARFPLVKAMSEDAGGKLQSISSDLYPSQLTVERQRLEQVVENMDDWEVVVHNNLIIVQWNVLKDLDLQTEWRSTRGLLDATLRQLRSPVVSEPKEAEMVKEQRRMLSMNKILEYKVRAYEILEQRKGNGQESRSRDLVTLKNTVLQECDSRMKNITSAKESLRSYTQGAQTAVHFLLEAEASLLPVHDPAGDCSSGLQELRRTLVSLERRYQEHVDQIQALVPGHPHLSSQKVEQLHREVLSGLLVRMTTFRAQALIRTQELTRCAEQSGRHLCSVEEISERVNTQEETLSRCLSSKVSSLSDCSQQQSQLKSLSEEAGATLGRLEALEDTCPEQGCRGDREAAVAALWWQLSTLQQDALDLSTQAGRRAAEWSEISKSVEHSSSLLDEVEAEAPGGAPGSASSEELQDQVQLWDQYQERLDWEHRALSALELRIARLLGVPAHLEQAPPTPLCQQVQAMQGRYHSLEERSCAGRELFSSELEEREKVLEDLQGARLWLEAADLTLNGPHPDLQEISRQLLTQKALLNSIMDSLKTKYSDALPLELETQLQEVNHSIQEVEVKVGEAAERSGPLHRLGSKLAEIRAGLGAVGDRLEQRSPSVAEAERTQKRVWDELDVWHSCLAALEVELQYLEVPEEALVLQERLSSVQEVHSQLAKQAEQRTGFLSKIPAWLQQHQEMIQSSRVWLLEAQTWLTSPCSYTSAKCLFSHVHALKMVLEDSQHIRSSLQGLGGVLEGMAGVCDVTALRQQLDQADAHVADAQDSFTAPLAQLEHTAAEVEAIETEVRSMERNVSEIRALLSSPETLPSPREDSLKVIEEKLQGMRTTVVEIQRCGPHLGLPEPLEATLAVFGAVDRLQTLLTELEKRIPALFLQQPPTPTPSKAADLRPGTAATQRDTPDPRPGTAAPQRDTPDPLPSTSAPAPDTPDPRPGTAAPQPDSGDPGVIRIAHLEQDVLTWSGATLQSVQQQASPDQRLVTGHAPSQVATDTGTVEGGTAPAPAGQQLATAGSTDSAPGEREGPGARSEGPGGPGTPPRPLGTVRTQSQPRSMVNTSSSTAPDPDPELADQQRCVVS
ncbi:unnamed protein product [Boreogadus saida]